MTLSQINEHLPPWANGSIIVGSATLAWIQPIAGIIAIVWGAIQIYDWIRKERRKWKR